MSSIDAELAQLRTPPYSIEAEQSVLGALILDNNAVDRIADLLRPEDFYNEGHRLIYEHIQRLAAQGKPADAVTVAESLRAEGKLEYVGGLAYIGAIANAVPVAANVHRYAEIVRDRSLLRRLASVATSIAEAAYNPMGRTSQQLIDDAEGKIFEIAEAGNRNRADFVSLADLSAQAIERIDALYKRDNPSEVTGIATGYTKLDALTAGFQRGDLIIIAGRPSMGKTSFALNIGEYVAIKQGLPVAVFSMEMSALQLAMRMIGSVGRLDQHKLRTGRLSDSDWGRFTDALSVLEQCPIYIDETASLNPFELRARARRLARQVGGLGLIIIDYLQLMSAASLGENRATELSEISRSLKALAKELNVPVVALSQLNRALEQRPNKRPVMSDLRESGAIEQDADLILFIYRDEVYYEDSPFKGMAEIIIGKQRNGPIGTVTLTFLGEFTRFENYADPAQYGVAPAPVPVVPVRRSRGGMPF
ncbi:MAG: replicative DNA helicase [Casimicrobiaceae bacterium]|nr:replicative DNA helicase [Casimicrobiaceae bacterium]MCX8098592.1 replicative DNA helicase [Casimicrobiaceae bacterium]MDW8312008.1 replicative DNA helicase [Burkholderiales bacterium]